MTWKHWLIVGAISGGVLGAALYMRRKIGAAVTADDRAGPDGIVPGKPEDLARAAGVPVDVYSLARVMESEESSQAGRVAVGWVTRNEARREKITITKLVTRAQYKDASGKLVKYASADGRYSTQDKHKWCATTSPPTAATLAMAKQVAAEPPKLPDPTKGATQWDAPELQDKLHAKDPAKYKTAAEIAAKRQAAGKKLVTVPGVAKTRFWV